MLPIETKFVLYFSATGSEGPAFVYRSECYSNDDAARVRLPHSVPSLVLTSLLHGCLQHFQLPIRP
jgi:hypothetical protein